MKKLRIRSDQEMIQLGKLLGERARPGDLLFLSGDLGAGKTTLVKGIGKGMNIKSEITSPTYQLLKTHQGDYHLNHLDLYRLSRESETEILELERLIKEGVTVIEWGDFLKKRYFSEFLEIAIAFTDCPAIRDVVLTPSGVRYEAMIEGIIDADFGN